MATVIGDLGNASGFIYITDTNGTSVLSSIVNSQDNVRRMIEDATFSNPVAVAGAYSAIFGHRYFLNSDAGAVQGVLTSSLEITSYVVNKGLQGVFPSDSYTIVSGVLTPSRKSSIILVSIEGEGGASDTLDTITNTGYLNGDIIVFKGATTSHVITFSNNTGNIKLANSVNFLTGDKTHSIVLQYSTSDTTWYEVTRSPNPAISVANLRAALIAEPVQGVNKTTLTNGGGTINLEPGVDKGYQVYDGTITLSGSWVIQIQASPSTAYLDGDTMFVDYRTLATVGANTITIFGITLTTTQALEGRVWLRATYKLSNTTWYYDIFYGASGVDITNKAYVDATFEPVLGNPAGNGYILSSTTGGVRTWIPNPAGNNLWEVGSGSGSIQTLGNGADASGDFSFAAGINAIASATDAIAIGDLTTASGLESIVIGHSSSAVDNGAIAIGSAANAIANAIALGTTATALGDSCISLGSNAASSGNYSVSVGKDSISSGDTTTVIGPLASATSDASVAIGYLSSATGYASNAIGNGAIANIDGTTNLVGALITKKGSLYIGGVEVKEGAATVVTVTTDELDLKTTFDRTITIPSGAKFYPDGVDVIITTVGGTITAQPYVRAGITGTLAKLLAIVQTTGLTATLGKRQKYDGLLSTDGESTLTFGVTTAATGSSTIKGRVVFRGLLIENE